MRSSKKSSGILCTGNRLEAYRFIQNHKYIFGVRWLLQKFKIVPNAYYNFLKNRKSDYHTRKQKVLNEISLIYHEHGGVDGYRSMKVYLERRGYQLSKPTVHNYMNGELGLYSVVRRKKPNYAKGTPHKVFDNLLSQDFTAAEINQKWCTDFTYLFLADGSHMHFLHLFFASYKRPAKRDCQTDR